MSFNPADFAAKSMREVPASAVRKLFDIASTLNDPVSLGIGEPDFATPMHICEAAWHSLQQGKTAYSPNAGIMPLREAVAAYLEKFDLHYDPATEIMACCGANQGLDLAFRTVLESGDEVILPEPAFLCYRPMIQLCGGKVVSVTTTLEGGFKVDPKKIEAAITPKTKALMLNFPSNPTGVVLKKEDLEELAQICIKHNLLVISDEIYAELTYEGTHFSIASLPGMKERTILITGASKAFAMTGWRLGCLCGPKELVSLFTKAQMYSAVCASTPSQYAGIEAFTKGQADADEMVAAYDTRRKYIVKAFRDLGLEVCEPLGAFYVFPSIQNTGLSSEVFSEEILKQQEVIVVPGNAFGPAGEGFIRCSYATSMADLERAVERMDHFLQQYR